MKELPENVVEDLKKSLEEANPTDRRQVMLEHLQQYFGTDDVKTKIEEDDSGKKILFMINSSEENIYSLKL